MKKIILNNIKNSIQQLNFLKDKKYIEIISEISTEITKTLKNNCKVIFCGNGGSAADSQHLSAELASQFLKKKRKSLASISLTTNSSLLTAIANDFSYDKIFSKQLEGIGKKEDFLFAISTSGSSKNIIEALKFAKKKGIKTFLLTGNKNKNKDISDFLLEVPANRVDRIQEMHILIGHTICELVENNF
jgi:D-sedoheptulose 7-phosphate isomerase